MTDTRHEAAIEAAAKAYEEQFNGPAGWTRARDQSKLLRWMTAAIVSYNAALGGEAEGPRLIAANGDVVLELTDEQAERVRSVLTPEEIRLSQHPEPRQAAEIEAGQVWLNHGGERFEVVDNTLGPVLRMLSDPPPRRERVFEASYMRKNMTLERPSEPRQAEGHTLTRIPNGDGTRAVTCSCDWSSPGHLSGADAIRTADEHLTSTVLHPEPRQGPRHAVACCPICAAPAAEGCTHEGQLVDGVVTLLSEPLQDQPVDRAEGMCKCGHPGYEHDTDVHSTHPCLIDGCGCSRLQPVDRASGERSEFDESDFELPTGWEKDSVEKLRLYAREMDLDVDDDRPRLLTAIRQALSPPVEHPETGEREDRRKGERRSGRERRSEANTPRSEMEPQRRDWSKPEDRRSGKDRRIPAEPLQDGGERELDAEIEAEDQLAGQHGQQFAPIERYQHEQSFLAGLRARHPHQDVERRQLDAVDKALPPWEGRNREGVECVGRVQTILNLVADRAELERVRAALAELVRLYELKQADPAAYEMQAEARRVAWFKAKALVAPSPDDRGGERVERVLATKIRVGHRVWVGDEFLLVVDDETKHVQGANTVWLGDFAEDWAVGGRREGPERTFLVLADDRGETP
jgi:hypothetical protein